jgi:hypothetical protein
VEGFWEIACRYYHLIVSWVFPLIGDCSKWKKVMQRVLFVGSFPLLIQPTAINKNL